MLGSFFQPHPIAGDLIRLEDGRMGRFQYQQVSPYFAEEIEGIERAYVVSADYAFETRTGNFWTEWVLPTDIKRVYKRQTAAKAAAA
jgi:hypothetical protein